MNKKDKSFTFTQLVLIQSFNDEFELSNKHPKLPAESGTTLVKTDAGGNWAPSCISTSEVVLAC
eukprot:463499-Ditylum_brightwellii.AAC.1